MKEDWEPENEVYLIGYEESETTDAPLYDDSITIESIHRPGLVLVFSSIPPNNDDLKWLNVNKYFSLQLTDVPQISL